MSAALRQFIALLQIELGTGKPDFHHTAYEQGRIAEKRSIADRLDALGDGWLPIDSAPRDAYEVLLADADCVCVGFWHDGSQCYGHRGGEGWFDSSDRYSLLTASNFHATHWMPLPEPPK